MTHGRSRSRRHGCRSRFCPSVAVSFRATSFPLCEKDPSLLCSYFSPSSWAVRTHKLLSKASLKASRKSGYSEAPLGAKTPQDTEKLVRSLFCRPHHIDCQTALAETTLSRGAARQRLPGRSVYVQGLQDMKTVCFDGYHCLIVRADI